MTESHTRPISIRLDMEEVHDISAFLDNQLRTAKETFDLRAAMLAYRKAYAGLQALIRPSTIGTIDSEIVAAVLSIYASDNRIMLPEGLQAVIEARNTVAASLL